MSKLDRDQRRALVGLMHLNSQTEQTHLDWLRSLSPRELAALQRDLNRTVQRFKGKTNGLDTLLRLGQAKYAELAERIYTEQEADDADAA